VTGMEGAASVVLHATCIVHHGRAALIVGASGSGKSGLALQLMAHGALLVADDRVVVTRDGDAVIASCPPSLSGMVEARGVGLLHARAAGPARLSLIVDLDGQETERLPPKRKRDLLGMALDLVFPVRGGHFPAAVLLYLTHGARAD